MIKKLFSLTALLLLVASCANDIDQASQLRMRAGQMPEFYATIEGSSDAETKVFADSKMRVLWNADDRIAIFNKYSYGYEYSFAGEDGANAGAFKPVQNNDFVTGEKLDHIYAVYPYAANPSFDNDQVLSVTLPAEQTYKEDSFGIGANTMVSVSDDNQLRFKNVGGYLSFKFYGEGVSIKSITLRSNNHEKLAGKAVVTMAVGGVPTTEMQPSATESITLTCATPVALGADAQHCTEFWFVVPPTTLTQGFTVTVTDALGGTFEMSSVKERVIERNKLIHMSAMKVVPGSPSEGVFYQEEPVYLFNKAADQVNIVEAEGNAWARFLVFPTLTMYEVGPIPANAAEGDSFDATYSVFVEGIETPHNLHLTVQSVQGGRISLVSDNGYRFVTRF